jgi:predicted transposase YbfD/YdcC
MDGEPKSEAASQKKWKDLNCIIRVKRKRKHREKEEEHVSYYIGSMKTKASRAMEVIRTHWKVESELHWTLDVIYEEDESRVRDKRQATNLALIRRYALCMLRRETSKKGSAVIKQAKAGWSTAYLEKVLATGLPES